MTRGGGVRAVAVASVLALAMGLGGCGYGLGYRLPARVGLVSVPQFRNETFPLRREIEYDLTRAVRQELELRTDARIVSRERAELVLEGIVLSFREGVLTEGPDNTEQESSIDVEVRIRWLRASDDTVLLDRVISDHVAYSTAAGESLEDARRQAIDDIAARIVSELESWDPPPPESPRA